MKESNVTGIVQHEYGAQAMTIDLLWTGGLDSTFRLLELVLVERKTVRTHYVIDRDRQSLAQELATLTEIRDEVLERLDDPERFPPTHMVLRDHLPAYPDIGVSFRRLKAQVAIGAQYEWLACFVRAYALDPIELGWPRHVPPSAFYRVVMKGGGEDAAERGVRLNDSTDVHDLFGAYIFRIMHRTKEELGVIADRNGFGDLLCRSWFCHRPIRGVPCGLCTPCHYAREQGRPIRFSPWRWLVWPHRNRRRWKAYAIDRIKVLVSMKRRGAGAPGA